jgi:hypothetical protein
LYAKIYEGGSFPFEEEFNVIVQFSSENILISSNNYPSDFEKAFGNKNRALSERMMHLKDKKTVQVQNIELPKII